jgi:transcriptional regulator with XRE-family HTH domain
MGRKETLKLNKRSPQSIDVVAGRNLRLLRGQRGYSQEKLGNEVGLTFQQIQKYENATNRMALSRAYELASILSVSIDAFFENTVSDPPIAFNDHSGLNEWLSLFARAHEADLIVEITALTSRILHECESARRSSQC